MLKYMTKDVMSPAEKAQEVRSAIQTAWTGNPLSYDLDGVTAVIDGVPDLALGKDGSVKGLELNVQRFDAQGNQVLVDGHRFFYNIPLIPRANITFIDAIDPLTKQAIKRPIIGKPDPIIAIAEIVLDGVVRTPNYPGYNKKATVTTSFGDVADDYIDSSHTTTYATARTGNALSTSGDATLTTIPCGQGAPGFFGAYIIDQAFFKFDVSAIPDSDTISSSVFSLFDSSASGGLTFDSDTFQARLFDWGAAVTTADWRSGAAFAALTLLCHLAMTSIDAAPDSRHDFTDDAMVANTSKTGVTYIVLCTSKFAANSAPTLGDRYNFYTTDQTGTTNDPTLTVTHSGGGATVRMLASLGVGT